MEKTKWNIGVCSWSLQAEIEQVALAMKELGIGHVNLAIGPALEIILPPSLA